MQYSEGVYSTSRITGILGLGAGLVLAAGCLETGSDAKWAPSGGGQGISRSTSNGSSNVPDDQGAGGVGDDLGAGDFGPGGFSGTGGPGSFAGFGDLGSAGSGGGAAGTSPPVSDPCVIEVPPGEPIDDVQGGVDGVTPCALQL